MQFQYVILKLKLLSKRITLTKNRFFIASTKNSKSHIQPSVHDAPMCVISECKESYNNKESIDNNNQEEILLLWFTAQNNSF